MVTPARLVPTPAARTTGGVPLPARPAAPSARRTLALAARRGLGNAGPALGVALIVLFCLAPFYWMFVSSLKGPNDIFNNDLWPASPTLVNYEAVFSGRNNFLYALRNSAIISGITTILAMLIGILAAYAFVRLQFRAKRLALGTVLAASMVPGVALLTPLFQLFSD